MSDIRERLWRRLAAGAGVIPACDKQLMYEAKDELEKQAAEVSRLRDWMQRVTDTVLDWRRKVTGTTGSGCPIDAVVVLSARLRKSEALIEQLRALLDGYEAMEKSMKQEASG